MIHEGTHGILAMDLLGRKVRMADGAGLRLLGEKVMATVGDAMMVGALREHAQALEGALAEVTMATRVIWTFEGEIDANAALANAVPYMQAFGHMVLAWTWLDVALTVCEQDPELRTHAHQGRMAACDYFFRYELPKIEAWLVVARNRDMMAAALSADAF